jgi:hypothetical protein
MFLTNPSFRAAHGLKAPVVVWLNLDRVFYDFSRELEKARGR